MLLWGLDTVHLQIGFADEVIGAVAAECHRGTDTDADGKLPTCQVERSYQFLSDPPRCKRRAASRIYIVEDNGKFISAQPGHHVSGANDSAQPLSQCHEQLISNVMPVRVVDSLEVVQVKVKEAEEGISRLLAAFDKPLNDVDQPSLVGKPRQHIMHRGLEQALLDALSLGNVKRRPH